MALSSIAYISINYRDYANWWLKAYEPGTTTPVSMALDSAGATTVAKLQINVDGFLVSAGEALVIPYVDGAYDLWLFPTEAMADTNDTSSALRVADDIEPPSSTGGSGDLTQLYTFETVALMKATSIPLPEGKQVTWQGYYAADDGGGNWGIVKTGAHTEDGGSIFSIDAATYVEANLKGDKINALKFGIKTNDDTFDSLPALDSLNVFVEGDILTTSERQGVIFPSGRIYISDTYYLAREVTYIGQGAKVTSFNPHSSWDNATEKYILRDAVLAASGQGRPDNNFFSVRRDFGTRNDDEIDNIGCFWVISGGGSEYRNLYLADARMSETMRVQGEPVSGGGDGGAVVATGFYNIWLANTTGGDGTSRARNGLVCDNAFSCSFYNLIVDYQSNSVDYTTDNTDTDGFGIKLDNCQVTFHGINMEGNHKPISGTNAQNCTFYGGAIYRKGLGAQTPSTDPDFLCRNASRDSMPSLLNMYASLGYGISNVGITLGVATGYPIYSRGDLNTAAGGAFTYFNANYLNIRELSSLEVISTPLELTEGESSLHMTPITRLFRSVYRTVYDEVVAGPASGNIDIPLNAHGKLTITACRSDSSNQNRGDVYDVLYSGEDSSGQLSITSQLNDATAALTFITGITFVYTGGGANIRIAYTSTAYPFNLTVTLDGRTSDNTDA